MNGRRLTLLTDHHGDPIAVESGRVEALYAGLHHRADYPSTVVALRHGPKLTVKGTVANVARTLDIELS